MRSKSLSVLVLLLPFAIAACDSNQPSYSGSKAPAAAPPPAATPAQPPAAPVQGAPAATTPAAPVAGQPAPATPAATMTAARATPAAEHRGQPLPPVPEIGVGGCDDYVARYRTCLNTSLSRDAIPMQQRIPLIRTFYANVRQWHADAAAGKTGSLANACAAADKDAREKLHQLGCTSF